MNDFSLKFNSVVVYNIDKKENVTECEGLAHIPDVNDDIEFNNEILCVVERVFNFNDNKIYLFVN